MVTRCLTSYLLMIYTLPVILYTALVRGQPPPIIAEVSQRWEGNNGRWSTFNIRVGTPSQNLRVLPDTASSETWVVLPGGCTSQDHDPSNCAELRGGLYNYNNSRSWVSTRDRWNISGYYSVANQITSALGIGGYGGEYGFDSVGFSWLAGAGPTVNHSIVAAYIQKEFYLGHLGLSPRPTNFTIKNDNNSALTDPQPSLLSLLKSTHLIPSLTWSYTAGSYSQSQINVNTFGSLIFGGYDISRSKANDVTFPFGPDDGRELVLHLRSITRQVGRSYTSLLTEAIITALDSTQPDLWLPLEVCEEFEDAFGLEWNETTRLYFLNETQRRTNLDSNTLLTLTLANGPEGAAEVVDIVLSYTTFDSDIKLTTATSKDDNSSYYYFPLKRAANETQFTLGRTFLQEAYLVADYERRNFSLSQVVWDNKTPQKVVAIPPINGSSEGRDDMWKSKDKQSPGLTKGAIVGIAIGSGTLLFAVLALVLFHVCRHRHRRHPHEDHTLQGPSDRQGSCDQKAVKQVAEMDPLTVFHEADITTGIFELPMECSISEIDTRTEGVQIFEIGSSS